MEAAVVKSKIRTAVKDKNRRGWTASRDAGSSVDWMNAAESVVDRFGGRIEEIRWTLGQNSTNSTAVPPTNSTTKALAARRVAYALVFPYLDMSHYANTSRDPKPWIESSQRRCRVAFTQSPTLSTPLQSPAELLIRASIEGVAGRICSTALEIFGESLLLGLPVRLDEVPRHPAELETRAESAVARWREALEDLTEWLGWSNALQCDRKCAPDEICQLPVWPLVSMSRRRGPWGGEEEEVAAAPVCVAWQP